MNILGLCFKECSIADKPMFIFVLGCGAILERQASHQVNRCAAATFLGLSIIYCQTKFTVGDQFDLIIRV